jgi:hypothetical protein
MKKNYIAYFLIFIAIFSIFVFLIFFPPTAYDWLIYFKPATLALLQGHSPFTVNGYYTPPWLLVFLIPFSILPDKIGIPFLFLTALASYIFIGLKSKANTVTLILFLTSPPVIYDLIVF